MACTIIPYDLEQKCFTKNIEIHIVFAKFQKFCVL